MAELELQGKTIEMETNGYSSKSYYAEIAFNTPESVESDFCKSVDIRLDGDSRQEMTFENVEKQINEYFKEFHPNLEILEFLSIEIEERERIKQRPYDNYEY